MKSRRPVDLFCLCAGTARTPVPWLLLWLYGLVFLVIPFIGWEERIIYRFLPPLQQERLFYFLAAFSVLTIVFFFVPEKEWDNQNKRRLALFCNFASVACVLGSWLLTRHQPLAAPIFNVLLLGLCLLLAPACWLLVVLLMSEWKNICKWISRKFRGG